jgi:hypothetical protein
MMLLATMDTKGGKAELYWSPSRDRFSPSTKSKEEQKKIILTMLISNLTEQDFTFRKPKKKSIAFLIRSLNTKNVKL